MLTVRLNRYLLLQNGIGNREPTIQGSTDFCYLLQTRFKAICAPFISHLYPVFLEQEPIEQSIHGKFLWTHTVHVYMYTVASSKYTHIISSIQNWKYVI